MASDERRTCSLPGCQRPNQQASGSGHSPRYCKHHVEFHRRHGSYWFKSLSAAELAPFRKAVRAWLGAHHMDARVFKTTEAIALKLAHSGRAENAYSLRGRPAQERADIALARLRNAEIDPVHILERAIVATLACEAKGVDERQREYRQVQIAKSIHRLASGTHKTPSGFYLPSKYPRSEGQVLRHMGAWLDELAAFAVNGRNIAESHSLA